MEKLDENIDRAHLIQLLNDDLAREYQAIIAYTVHSQIIKGAKYIRIAEELRRHAAEELGHALKIAKQIDYLGGTPAVEPAPVERAADPKRLLEIDMENERAAIVHYRHRIRQAEATSEYALSETLREIIAQEQEHFIELAGTLGIEAPDMASGEHVLRT